MKRSLTALLALVLMSAASPAAFAQPHDDHYGRGQMQRGPDGPGPGGPPRHNWRRGGQIDRADWNRGQRVDYRSHHLRRPGRGQEWREVDGNYVLAAIAGGAIASLIASH